MLCKTCKNKHICKHYEYIKNIDINMIIQITDCELFSSNNEQPIFHNPDKRSVTPLYREPLPSTYQENEEEEIDDEDEEKVYINIDNYDNNPKTVSIVDMIMKGDK